MRLQPWCLCVFGGMLVTLAAPSLLADARPWQIDSARSRVNFTVTQQGAPFQGTFETFAAEIRFDPKRPAQGSISASIVMGSVNTQNDERDGYLIGPDFFHVEQFPEARFETSTIRVSGDGFEAEALLTIRDVSKMVVLPFQWRSAADGSVRFTGAVPVQRLDFGVGQGMWADTTWIGAEVLVQVDLLLTR